MISKTRVTEALRSLLGDQFTSWLHALRYYWLLRIGKENEVDMRLIPHLVHKGDIVIDVGANSADWTWRLSRQVGENGKVFAFEADPYYAEVTRKVIVLLRLKNVTFFAYGLSDKSGTALLQIRAPDNQRVVGTGHIVDESDVTNTAKRNVVPVTLTPLDEVPELKPFVESVQLIKCDVEGHELNVFKGASGILTRSRPLVITEVGHTEYQNDNKQQLISFFDALNYQCYVVSHDNCTLLRSRPDGDPGDARPNRIMIPKEKDQTVAGLY